MSCHLKINTSLLENKYQKLALTRLKSERRQSFLQSLNPLVYFLSLAKISPPIIFYNPDLLHRLAIRRILRMRRYPISLGRVCDITLFSFRPLKMQPLAPKCIKKYFFFQTLSSMILYNLCVADLHL